MGTVDKIFKVAAAASLWSAIIVAVSCSPEVVQHDGRAEAGTTSDQVSVEIALAALARFQEGDFKTRTGESPAIAHVDILMRSEVKPMTRSSAPTQDAPLCYIAQFDGGGYAILGADKKQASVVAYVPKGSLTAAELAAAKAKTDRGEDYETPTFIHAGIVEYLEAAQDGKVSPETNGIVRNDVETRVILLPLEPVDTRLLRTQWTQ